MKLNGGHSSTHASVGRTELIFCGCFTCFPLGVSLVVGVYSRRKQEEGKKKKQSGSGYRETWTGAGGITWGIVFFVSLPTS